MFTKKSQFALGPFGSMIAAAAMLASPTVAQQSAGAVQAPLDIVNIQLVEEDGGSARINLAGNLRMLSQRIPAAACSLNAGIAPTESEAALSGALADFDRILAGLEFGDEELGVFGAEERRKTLRIIEELQNMLAPMKAALAETSDGVPTEAAVQVLADANMDLLGVAAMLVTELASQYANPTALLQADALTMDIAGRQRMLTQKASKEVCLVLSGVNADASREEISGTVNIFESSLDALRNGNQAVGILAPRDEAISEGLNTVLASWTAIKPHLETVQSGGTLDDETRAIVFMGLNNTMVEMNSVVALYTEQSKLGD